MEEAKPNIFDSMKECLSKVKVYNVGDEEHAKVVDVGDVVKGFFDNLVDDETKNLVNKLSTCSATESIDILKDYQKQQEEKRSKGKEKEEVSMDTNVSELVRSERELRDRISSLSPKEKKEYYAQLYQIPTDKDIHNKLDLVLERLEDLSSEVAIMRRQLCTK